MNRRVAVLIESSRQYGRELALGIARYAAENGNWSIYSHERKLGSRLPPWMHNWQGDGILMHTSDMGTLANLQARNLPVVSLYEHRRCGRVPVFAQDDRAVARMAMEYFLHKGFVNFAFCGIADRLYALNRQTGVQDVLGSFGLSAATYDFSQQEIDGEIHARPGRVARFVDWLGCQPKPLALFAANDDVACVALFLCRAHRVAVPGEVAILGVDNDPIRTCLIDPRLSSIQSDALNIGYRAAQHLEWMMRTGDRRPIERYFSPQRVVERESSVIRVVEDALVKSALELISADSGLVTGSSQLAAKLGVCRNTLDARFRKALRRSVHEHILEERLTQAQIRLEKTRLPIESIARDVGMSKEHFCRVFKQKNRLSPGAYRESVTKIR